MRDFDKIINNKDLERNNGKMVCFMKGIIVWGKNMERVLLNFLMEHNMKEIFRIISTTGLGNLSMMIKCMKEIELKEKNKGNNYIIKKKLYFHFRYGRMVWKINGEEYIG